MLLRGSVNKIRLPQPPSPPPPRSDGVRLTEGGGGGGRSVQRGWGVPLIEATRGKGVAYRPGGGGGWGGRAANNPHNTTRLRPAPVAPFPRAHADRGRHEWCRAVPTALTLSPKEWLSVLMATPVPAPHMVTCELSRVVCWLAGRQHNRHMQFTRRKEKLVKSRTTALGAFRKRSVGREYKRTFCM